MGQHTHFIPSPGNSVIAKTCCEDYLIMQYNHLNTTCICFRLVHLMVKYKVDFAKVAPYMIATYVCELQEITLPTQVKVRVRIKVIHHPAKLTTLGSNTSKLGW